VGSPAPASAKSPGATTAKPAPALPLAPATPLRREDIRRTIVLMVDDLGLSFESTAFVRSSLRKFVERQMQPGDLVAICRTGAGSGALQQFTSDKRILLSVINGLHYNLNGRAGLNFFEPSGKAGASAANPSGAADALNISYDVGRNTIFTVGTLGAINYIVGALREMPGRKSIVLFSDGLQLFTPAQGPIRHEDIGSLQNMESNAEIVAAMRKLVDRANRAGTVIYTMLSSGLQTLAPDAQDRVDMTGMSPKAANGTMNALTHVGMIGGRDMTYNAGRQGLAYLAEETGGVPYEPGNDLNWGLDRVLEDQQGYYLIGFKPPSDTFEVKHGARGYHHVTVKVTRQGLHVRSRTGFFGATDDETMPKYATDIEQIRAAMLSPFRSSGVRLRLTALYAEVAKRGPVVRNLLHIDTRDLTFQAAHGENLATHAAGDSSAEIEVVAMATSMGEIPVASVARLYKVQAPADRFLEAVREGALYTLDVPVKKRGAYQIQVAVRDTATGKVGSASQFLEIPELKKGRVALTSIVLQDAGRTDGTPAWTGMSPVTRRFHSGSQVEYLCLVENTGKKVLAANLDSQIMVVRDGKSVYTGPAKLVSMAGGGLALTGKLKLGQKMTPGDYYLGIVTADRTAPKSGAAAQWTDFEITP
jgi:VWFA-related protein